MSWYPRSFFALALAGTTLAAVPVLLALASTSASLQRLATQSRDAVYQTALAARASRQLTDRVVAMERTARQYLVLDDPALLGAYERHRVQFSATTGELAQLPLDEAQRHGLERAIAREALLWTALSAASRTAGRRDELLAGMNELSALARTVLDASNLLIEREVDRLGEIAGNAQVRLLSLLAAALPLAAALALGFAWLIARPVRELEAAIRRLGAPDLAAEIRVHGPRDIETIGEHLDWLRRRLAELEDQKAKFLRHISHELKTPLTALREGSELLADGSAGPLTESQRDVAGILRSNSVRLQKLVMDLLDYHRATDPRAMLDLRDTDVAAVVRDALDAHRLSAASRSLRLEARLSPVTAKTDADKLRVVADNLVGNAVKFSPDGGTVALSLDRRERTLVLDVVDQGPGIRPEDRERVFDWFFQGRAAASGPVQGSGLGLAIAREWALAHGGSIEAIERAKGAHLRLTLPLSPGECGAA